MAVTQCYFVQNLTGCNNSPLNDDEHERLKLPIARDDACLASTTYDPDCSSDHPKWWTIPQVTITKPQQELPQLCIPIKASSRDVFQSETPETPASLSSPIVGIVDLTKYVKTLSPVPLCHGGFCDIYLGGWERRVASDEGGEEIDTQVQVAIKLLRVLAKEDEDGVRARKRLNREVYVWHRLDHPNIVRLFGTSYHMSGRPAMIMKWYGNGSAVDYLKLKPGANRMILIRDIARGLRYLHTLIPPIVHGDLKGNNILITDDGEAVISDFGLSKVIEDLVGNTGNTASSPDAAPLRWQSPEFLRDETCLPRLPSDVWSFACTAYELLTGNIPYHHRVRDYQVIKDIEAGIMPPGPDDTASYDYGSEIWQLLNRCWSLNPDDRPSMVDVELELENICSS